MLCNYYLDEEEEDKGNAKMEVVVCQGGESPSGELFCFVLSSDPSFHDSDQVDIQ